MKQTITLIVCLVLLVAACWYGYSKYRSLNPPRPNVPPPTPTAPAGGGGGGGL